MGMLAKMQDAREDDNQMFEIKTDNDFDKVKELLFKKQRLREKTNQLERDVDKITQIEMNKNLKNINRQR